MRLQDGVPSSGRWFALLYGVVNAGCADATVPACRTKAADEPGSRDEPKLKHGIPAMLRRIRCHRLHRPAGVPASLLGKPLEDR
jgi:hypothetical protein